MRLFFGYGIRQLVGSGCLEYAIRLIAQPESDAASPASPLQNYLLNPGGLGEGDGDSDKISLLQLCQFLGRFHQSLYFLAPGKWMDLVIFGYSHLKSGWVGCQCLTGHAGFFSTLLINLSTPVRRFLRCDDQTPCPCTGHSISRLSILTGTGQTDQLHFTTRLVRGKKDFDPCQ